MEKKEFLLNEIELCEKRVEFIEDEKGKLEKRKELLQEMLEVVGE